MDDNFYKIAAISILLNRLKIAGLQKKSISMSSMILINHPPVIPKYALRLATVSLSIDYLIAVPYADRDRELDTMMVG